MKRWEVMAAVIAAILLYAVFVCWPGKGYSRQEEYKDVYEQMRMERMITRR